MQWFVVKYRKPDGTMTEAEFEAADRSDLFRILAEQKISAISIASGRSFNDVSRSLVSTKIRLCSPKCCRTVMVGAFAAFFAGVVCYFLSMREISNNQVDALPNGRDECEEKLALMTNRVFAVGNASSKDSIVKLPKGEIAKPRERGQVWGTQAKLEEAKRLGKKPKFSHLSESYLAMYAIPGEHVPPMPRFPDFEDDVIKALIEPIEILPGDSEEDVRVKEMVAGMKDELKQFIKDGGTVSQYFDALAKRQETEANYYVEALQMVQASSKNDDTDEAFELWKKTNEHLAEKGIKQIPLPRRLWKTHKHLVVE